MKTFIHLLYPLPTLLTPFPDLVTPLPRIFIKKGNANNDRNLHFAPFPVIVFINQEAIGCINEEAIGAINKAVIKAPRNLLSCFFISCFSV